jgi:hypothetical protein
MVLRIAIVMGSCNCVVEDFCMVKNGGVTQTDLFGCCGAANALASILENLNLSGMVNILENILVNAPCFHNHFAPPEAYSHHEMDMLHQNKKISNYS